RIWDALRALRLLPLTQGNTYSAAGRGPRWISFRSLSHLHRSLRLGHMVRPLPDFAGPDRDDYDPGSCAKAATQALCETEPLMEEIQPAADRKPDNAGVIRVEAATGDLRLHRFTSRIFRNQRFLRV